MMNFSGIEVCFLKFFQVGAWVKIIISWLPGFLIRKRVSIRNPGDQDNPEMVRVFALIREED